ncbi:MAG TPA: UDP-glucose/GDP-mannose dehydrogenase family protein [Bryobacterales bacterium]|nr:UDP-glucose/GDP-mannose dehydrogenase family protein [Bryobacterales bacterium]
MKITVIGTGHVGLVVGLCFAEIGHEVGCHDLDQRKIGALSRGETPFYEPHLDELLRANRERGRIRFFSDLEPHINDASVIFLCLGTPPLPDGEADLSSVEKVTRQIATHSNSYKLIVEKSTVPVLTGDRIDATMKIYGSSAPFDIASNPEFLSEGTAAADFLHPQRTVIGVESERAEKLLREIYDPILRQCFPCPIHPQCEWKGRATPLVVTNRNSAEVIKHASNSFLATKISFINAIANLCERVGADVEQVALGMGLDPRIGPSFLHAGIGFGGFCFPKDLQAFVHIAEKNGYDLRLLREVERINNEQMERFFLKIKHEVWVLKGKRIAAWGLAFKPETDDVRFAPALTVIERLLAEGSTVAAYDPRAMDEARAALPDGSNRILYCSSAEEAAAGADALVIFTEWKQFREANWERLRQSMARPLIIDGRNMFQPEEMRRRGFEYASIGRP